MGRSSLYLLSCVGTRMDFHSACYGLWDFVCVNYNNPQLSALFCLYSNPDKLTYKLEV